MKDRLAIEARLALGACAGEPKLALEDRLAFEARLTLGAKAHGFGNPNWPWKTADWLLGPGWLCARTLTDLQAGLGRVSPRIWKPKPALEDRLAFEARLAFGA